ncbi:restriction endonuclease subunit S [Rhizobium ruizarguesonis]|uniref:restriction endonuclease subunit S n=1 Tax=Rhizobium ruizarguesonis TaxID=2081791 RepID=UPI00103263DF|nr:restriction endonuclease subunit S [Rhizobium ruizarguesonis]TAX75465.1 restriction endonuclease subunit S [Rhizobium ruizarguesonis]
MSLSEFDDVIRDASGGNAKVQNGDYLSSGQYPIIDQGQDFIGGYTNDPSNLVAGEGPWIVFGDHTRALKFVDFPFCMGADGVKVLQLQRSTKADLKYVCHFLQFANIPSAGYSRHYKFLKRLQIPLPRLEDQERIAAILDKADQLRQKRRHALALLDALTQSIFLKMFGNPAKNSKGLPLVALGEVGDWQSGGTPSRTRQEYFNGTIPWASSGELNDIYLLDCKERISEMALIETSAKEVPQGALMLGMYDTAALKSSISSKRCSCNQAIAFAKLDETRIQTLYAYFAVQVGKEEFRRLQRGVRQKNLNLSMIKSIKIPAPGLDKQLLFAAYVRKNLEIREKMTATIRIAELNFSSLQHRAFIAQL